MLRIIIFIALKLVELGAITILPYYIGRLGARLVKTDGSVILTWLLGASTMVVAFVLLAGGAIAIEANWAWAKTLAERWR